MTFDNYSVLASYDMMQVIFLEDYIAAVKLIDFGKEWTESKGIHNGIIAFALCCLYYCYLLRGCLASTSKWKFTCQSICQNNIEYKWTCIP